MSRELQELRNVVTKLVPMLAGRGLKVTQRGSKAYVAYSTKTNQPELVNIPNVPDDAKPEFVRAIQGFIDHEVAHVLITDPTVNPQTQQSLRDPKAQRLHHLHNIVEDTMIEREMVKLFPGARKNIADLRTLFISDVTEPALRSAIDDDERVNYLVVPLMRALAGHKEFKEWMDANDYWSIPKIAHIVKSLKPETIKALPTLTSTKQTLVVARELEAILYPPPPPPPPVPAPPPEDNSPAEEEEQSSGESQDKPEKEAGEGDGDGERDHKEQPDAEDEEGGDAEGDGDASGDEAEGEQSDAEDKADASPADGDEKEKQSRPENSGDGDGRDEADDEDGPEKGDEKSKGDAGEGEDDAEGADQDDTSDADSGDAADGADGDDEEGEQEAEGGASGDDDGDGEEGDDDAGEGAGGDTADDKSNDKSDGNGEARGESATDDGDGSDASDTAPSNGLSGADDPQSSKDVGEGEEHDQADPSGVGSEIAKAMFDYDDDAFSEADVSNAIAGLIEKEAIAAFADSDYNVFTRDFDRIEPLKVPAEMPQDWVTKLEDSVRSMTGRLQKDVERMMAAKNRVVRVSGHRTGRIHAPSLHRAMVGDDRLFYRKEEHTALDTAVTLLCDNSGSMGGAKCRTAMQAAYALATTLDRVKIPFEMLGFTTGGWPAMSRAEQERVFEEMHRGSVVYHRTIPLVMPIYKSFAERVSPQVKQRIAYMAYQQPGLNGNIDGECLQYAAQRLAPRKERRKVLIVFSDGQPAGINAEPHLYKVVRELEAAKIETIGIGIMDKSVQRFYPKHVVLNKLEDLPGEVMSQLKSLLA